MSIRLELEGYKYRPNLIFIILSKTKTQSLSNSFRAIPIPNLILSIAAAFISYLDHNGQLLVRFGQDIEKVGTMIQMPN